MKIMITTFKRFHACTLTLTAPNPAAGYHWPTPLLETPGHSQTSLGQSLVGSTAPFSWVLVHIRFCLCPSKVYFPVLLSSGSSMVGSWWRPPRGLMPYPSLLYPEPLSLWQSTAGPSLHSRCSTQFCLSLSGGPRYWCTQGLFEPSECLWEEWDLMLNTNSPHLQSCWGFPFALGCVISPHGSSSTAQTPKMKLYTVRKKKKTGSWLWLRSWTLYCQIQT